MLILGDTFYIKFMLLKEVILMQYQEIRPAIAKNKYMLTELTNGIVPAKNLLPAFFDDLTYTPLGIEFKVKGIDGKGKEESLVYFFPVQYLSGFEFKKNPKSEDANTTRFHRLD